MKKILGGALAPLFILVLLLAACGGNPGTKVTVRADDISGQSMRPQAVAFQAGNGEWTRVWPGKNGDYTFYVPAGEKRYGVAVKCSGMLADGAFGSGATYFLTTDESTEPQLPCFSVGSIAQVKGTANVAAVATAAGLRVEASLGSSSQSGTSMNYSVQSAEGSDRDLVLLAFSSGTTMDSSTLIGGRIFRGVNAVGVVDKDLTLAAGDTVSDHNFAAFTVPAGWSGHYDVSLYTAGGAVVDHKRLGDGNASGGTYHALPGTSAGDLYWAEANASSGSDNRSITRARLIPGDAAGDISLAPTIDPLPSSYAPTTAVFPSFPLSHPDGDLSGYEFMTFWPYTIWTYTLSKGWIAGQTQFTVPDLTGLVGFEDAYPRKGEGYSWFASAFKASVSMQSYLEAGHLFFDIGFGLPRLPGMTIDAALTSGDFTTP